MNHFDHGLSTGAKAGIVIVLVVLVLGAAYLAYPMLTGGGTSSTSSSRPVGSSSSTGTAGQPTGLLKLFASFSQMKMVEAVYDNSEAHALNDQHTISYQVLGTASLNSTSYTKVKFTQSGATSGNGVIAWFNQQGGIDRVDVLGVQNYTGPGSSIYAQLYTSIASETLALTANSSLLSTLSKTAQTTTTIGSTQLNVVNYTLAKAAPPYDNLTLSLATIPGTTTTFAIYFDVQTPDQLETVFQVLSLSK